MSKISHKKAAKASTRPRRMPRQERSRAMVDVIVEATWKVLAEEGYAAASTNRIAERAGTSVGSLYQYFPNKDAIVAAVQRRHHADLGAVMATAFAEAAGQPLEKATRRLVRASLDAHLLDPDLHRTLSQRVPDSVNPETRGTLKNGIQAQIRSWLEGYRPALTVTDLDTAAFVVLHLVESVSHAAILDQDETPDPARVEDELTATVVRYLTG
ncbi:TetR/AcrR family transcriptional regulator [Pelagibius litoralis]|uniref:TetR/AcrR family transcriptional regulator n=1 Tax=Pelagibius litoralis TaxID=374515 RepID=A0A967KAQ2_9PROT|nr:TetR/AcrR family transcriptional regulator [Pelagibius litoralis]NIA71758.1 TetR/AcrR family transcriptional regulator [Pelagibius litoralis]